MPSWMLEPPWAFPQRTIDRILALGINVDQESPKTTAVITLAANSTKKNLSQEREHIIEKFSQMSEQLTLRDLFEFLDHKPPKAQGISRGNLYIEGLIARSIAGDHVLVLPHESSSHTDGRTIWLKDYLDPDRDIAALFHEVGHVTFGSMAPVPAEIFSAIKDSLPPRDFLSLGEVFALFPYIGKTFVILEEYRINYSVAARYFGEKKRYFEILNSLWQELSLDLPLPTPKELPLFLEQIQGFGYSLDFLSPLKKLLQKTPIGRIFEKIQRKIATHGGNFSRDDLFREIINHFKKIDQSEDLNQPPIPGLSATLSDPPKHRIFAAPSTDNSSVPTANSSAPTTEKQSSFKRPSCPIFYPEQPIFSGNDQDVVAVDEVIDGKLCVAVCEMKRQKWVPFFDPILPAFIDLTPVLPPKRPSLARRGKTTSQLHRAICRVAAGLPSQLWMKARREREQANTKTQNTCIIDLTTSMCAQRPGFTNTPIEIALGIASALHDLDLAETYGSIDGGRKMNYLYKPEHPRQLHEVGAGGFRLGPIIRLFGRSPEPQRLLILSDTAFGQYVGTGYETMHSMNRGFRELWKKNCRTCERRRTCCIDPSNETERNRSERDLNVWHPIDHVYHDVGDALAANPHVEVFCFVLEIKTSLLISACQTLSQQYPNIRFLSLEESDVFEQVGKFFFQR